MRILINLQIYHFNNNKKSNTILNSTLASSNFSGCSQKIAQTILNVIFNVVL